MLDKFRNGRFTHVRGGNRPKVVIASIPHAEDCDQELSDVVSEDSDEDVHDFIVIDLEEVAYDNHDVEHMDTLSRNQII